MAKKKRVQLDMSQRAVDRLDSMIINSGSSSRAEVVRRALALYDRVLKGGKDARLFIEEDGKTTELALV